MKLMNKSERFAKLSEMGCIVCLLHYYCETPPQIHHIRKGAGMGRRSPFDRTIPLCPTHHQHGGHGMAFHAGKKAWEARFGTELSLLAKVNNLLENM